MDYSIIGFPRIGAHRELKFATEKYFRGEISAEELKNTVVAQREAQWKLQKDAGVAYIPSNDYSLYDGVLDAAFMLNAIPARYASTGLSDLDVYFAMAHGYQGEKGDVKAFTMKKWFNTNYHYMVSELDDDMTIKLRPEALVDAFRQAEALGIKTKPVVVGPFTFLKLAKTTGSKTKADFLPAILNAYEELLGVCNSLGAEWLQLDEPSLVTDLTADEIALFVSIYEKLLAKKGSLRVLAQTYFGDVRDCYKELCALDFDAIGLDFVEGKRSAELVAANGFPADKILFAGVVNGKNIWRCNYKTALDKVNALRAYAKQIVLNTSCSLLHVPYTISNESKLDSNVIKFFAFAVEKLVELKELGRLAELKEYQSDPAYVANQELLTKDNSRTDADVQSQIAALTDADFKRPQPRKERQDLQRKVLNLPLLPTTTIGSFPQTAEVRQNRAKFRKGEISEETYRAKAKDFIRQCVALQEEIGLDVLVHGEFERNDMVEFFGENLDGYVFTENAWVQSYGTRGVKPPIVFADVKRKKSITTDYISYANSLTKKDVKGMLTGPVTILNWSFPREDVSLQEMMYQIGLAIRGEVMELEAAGVRVIQIDEAALREKLPLRRADWHEEYLDFAIKAFRLCSAKVKPETQIHTHMCYSEFEDIIPEIDSMDADVITFEASRSKLTILDSLKENNFETEVGPGVYDIHSPRVPSVEEIEVGVKKMLEKIPVENLWINPDCGLKTRGETETVASLKNLVQAARELRKTL
ncbi:MAG: 5-methyltetrahydropteroyltriglutamate--homocysteine S-methyltransferase [Thermoguttaceae bacterium]|nr:5-methyltetrahydropteroyltriglutamate--homocysteine S-methyltransferase [Thermoguttaceae bacterium]